MSVHWKNVKIDRSATMSQMELAKAEARDRRVKEAKRAAFAAKKQAGVEKVLAVLDAGGVVVRGEKYAIDVALWKEINRAVIREIKGLDGYRFKWDDDGFMAEGPGHKVAKAA